MCYRALLVESPRQRGVGRGCQGRVVVAEHGAGDGGGGSAGAGRVRAPHSGDDGEVVVMVLLTVAGAASVAAARRQGVVRGRQGPVSAEGLSVRALINRAFTLVH